MEEEYQPHRRGPRRGARRALPGPRLSFPIALEGALKLKEISYIHAEGYAGGEMKHGPIALIDETVPVVVVAPTDALFDKIVSNFEQVTGARRHGAADADAAAAPRPDVRRRA